LLEGLTRSRRRAISLIAVLVGHAVVLIAFIYATRPEAPAPALKEFISTWISQSAPVRVAPQRTVRQRVTPPKLQAIEPLTPPPVNIPPLAGTPGNAVDWAAEAGRAADAATSGPKPRAFGPRARTETEPAERQRDSPHFAGEEYTDSTGSHIVWTSDRCYLASDPPLPGIPKGLNFSRIGCVDYSKPPGELFKDLPAYKKNHAQK
jgi:hypothetical protein